MVIVVQAARARLKIDALYRLVNVMNAIVMAYPLFKIDCSRYCILCMRLKRRLLSRLYSVECLRTSLYSIERIRLFKVCCMSKSLSSWFFMVSPLGCLLL